MIAKEIFDQVVAYLEEQGYFLAGWGGMPLDKRVAHRVLQIRKASRLKRPKETWGTLWFKGDSNDWMIYCWLDKKSDKLSELAGRLGKRFNTKVEFCVIHKHK